MPVFTKRDLDIENLPSAYYTDPEDVYFGLPKGDNADMVRSLCKGYGQLALLAQNAAVDAREQLITLITLAAPNIEEHIARTMGGPQRMDEMTTGEILVVALPLMRARDEAVEKVLLWDSYGHGAHLHEKVQVVAAGLEYERQLRAEIEKLQKQLTERPASEALTAHLVQVTAERDAAVEARDAAQEQVAALQRQLTTLQAKLTTVRATPIPPVFSTSEAHQTEPVPHGIFEFQAAPAYERSRVIVQLLGETGVPLQPDLIKRFVERTGQSNATARRAITACMDHGLLEQHAVVRASGGPLYLVQLTELGRQCYRHIYGQVAVPRILAHLLKQHDNPQHVYLILETQRILEAAGFAVDLYPAAVPLVDYGEYRPDLVAHYGEQMLYVEAENTRSPKNNREQRRAKWQRAAVAGKGKLHITVWRTADGRALASNIVRHAETLNMPLTIYMLALNAPAIGQGMSIWQLERQVY
ncbi:MAG: hypothetical protein JXA21_07495 [Anaerolineae bacterium]|nr:hypothetical protein [Anaerolineae bacterium]